MTVSKRRRLAAGSTLKAYEAFHEVADRGHYRKACTVFKREPLLIQHMTFTEIPCHCAMMSQQLGKPEVEQFIAATEEHLNNLRRMLKTARLYDNSIRVEEERKND